MAKRPVYLAMEDSVETHQIEFKWHPGFAKSQAQKSILALHEAAAKLIGVKQKQMLEISSKSENPLGNALSAFNLKGKTKTKGREFTVEAAFQASKVFEGEVQHSDLFGTDSRKAKKDPRIRNSGRIKYFRFFNDVVFPNYPETAFYDWLYINTLLQNPQLHEDLMKYRAFTDIVFNPEKSLNTQAHSAALYVSLRLAGENMSTLRDPEVFLEKTRRFYNSLFGKIKPHIALQYGVFVILKLLSP